MRLVKIKEGQHFKFFVSDTIDVYANKFQSTDEVVLLVPNEEDPFFFFFFFFLSGDQICFEFLSLTDHQKAGRGSSVRSASTWYADGHGYDPHVQQHSLVEIGHEIISTAILALPLIQEGQLPVIGERMCTKY